LDQANVGAVLEQMGGEAVPQRMQRDLLVDPRRLGRIMEQPAQLAGGEWLGRNASGKQPALQGRHAVVVARRPYRPPLPQQGEPLGRQHHRPVLAPLDRTMRMMFCTLSISPTLSRTISP